MPTPEPISDWFEKVWQYREETLYPALFGSSCSDIYTIQPETITNTFLQETFDPSWLHYGVIEFTPTPTRSSWLYVTSGMSNDWEADVPDPKASSGFGCEFLLETVQQSRWAIVRLLHLMTFQILLVHGRYQGRDALGDFDRIPLRSSIREDPSVLTYLMLAPPSNVERQQHLDSGTFDFFQVVGISEAEAAYAREHGGPALLVLLISGGGYPITNPDRSCVVDQPI